jgi:nucleoside phosphorylase
LEENKITIHQAFYGEVNRAHSCIKQTLFDPDLTSFLIAFTDRPAALPPGVYLLPYISGCAFTKYYILTKSFPDQTATRAGMVFTHVLILNQNDIDSINNLQSLLSLFVESTDNKDNELREFQADISRKYYNITHKQQPKYIQEVISAYITGVNPILFEGEISTFSNALQQIWNSPNISARKKLKFRTSFTISDIENVNDLTIVSIQKDFLPKWQGKKIIHGINQDMVEITSYSETLFLGYKEGNPFYNFLVELNVNIEEVQSYGQYEKVFINYFAIDKVEDANIIRQDIRVLSKISPSSTDGIRIKGKFIEQLLTLLNTKKDTNLKALRNIDWSAFIDGEKKGRQIVSLFIAGEIENPNQKQIQALSELADLSVTEKNKNWWHESIIETIETTFRTQCDVSIKNIWQLIDFSEGTLINILSIIGSIKDCDSTLRKYLPEKLRTETCRTLIPIAQSKNWYLFHADILIKQFSTESSLEKQLEVEEKLSIADSFGVKYLADKLASKKLLEVALKTSNKKLIELSAEAIFNDVSLLTNMELEVSCWLNIWSSFVLKTKNIFWGLTGKEQAIVFSVFDLILKGRPMNDTIIGLIADTPYSDISEYQNRNKVWGTINHLHKEKFLTSTTEGVLNDLLSGKIESKSIEVEISDRITSDVYMTKFLNNYRNEIEPVLKLFASFNNLKDNFLSDYISYYRGTISEAQSDILGELVSKHKFYKSARSIYDKAKFNNSFKPAFENCKDIVTLNWWESLNIFATSSKEQFTEKPYITNEIQKENVLRNELPTVVILTAIKEEYLAVREHINEIVPAKQNDTHYEAGIFKFNGKEIAKIIIRECGAKNTTSAIETERAIQYFKPNAMFFVGIAGSRKPKDFSIGDVIFPETILSYEGGKSEKESFLSRPDIGVLTYAVLETAKAERKKEDWKMLIKNSIDPKSVKADIGIIASGEQVVDDYESEIGKILTKYYNQTSAIEMEGFGFAKTINRQGRETSNIMTGIVRGISDIIVKSSRAKRKDETDRRPANVKQLASCTAAAFAFWLILKTFEE